MVTKGAPAALACSTKSFHPSGLSSSKRTVGDFFGDEGAETAHAVAGDERHHIVLQGDEIVRLHFEGYCLRNDCEAHRESVR